MAKKRQRQSYGHPDTPLQLSSRVNRDRHQVRDVAVQLPFSRRYCHWEGDGNFPRSSVTRSKSLYPPIFNLHSECGECPDNADALGVPC